MESLAKIAQKRLKNSAKPKVDSHLHSPNHLLADELCTKLHDQKRFGFYLRMAALYNHDFLRNLASQVVESRGVKTPGKLFAFLIKKHNLKNKSRSHI